MLTCNDDFYKMWKSKHDDYVKNCFIENQIQKLYDNKQLQKQNLDELMKQTLLNILSAKGIIYTYYKNKKLTQGNYEQRKSKYNS